MKINVVTLSIKKKVIDWDGVLLDSLGASYNVYNKIFEQIGTRRLTKTEFLELQSPNWYEFYSKVGLPAELWARVDEGWLRLYDEERPRLFSDATRCLEDLKAAGLGLAVVSNGSEARVERELRDFGVATAFSSVLCGREKEELKPSPVMIQRTLAALGLEPEEAVYVGDAPADIQAAKNAGVASVAVARDAVLEARLRAESPDCVLRGLEEMTGFLVASGSPMRPPRKR